MERLLLTLALAQFCQCTVISIAQGKVRGIDKGGYIFYGGIPYGSVGKNDRFKTAGLAPTWDGVRESRRAQYTAGAPTEFLQLDVYMPATAQALLPVLVWARGGEGVFRGGKLALNGVIVVVVTHRVGPLGFLCSNDERIPGNAGVKDFVLALRWVRDNINAFRGNPAETVIGGQSFGAAMVEAIKLSQMGEGLYRGVISQSGSILSPTAFYQDAEERTFALAKDISNDDDVIGTLLDADSKVLIQKARQLDYPYYSFGVCVEDAFQKEERLLSESPYDSLTNGRTKDVPMLLGFNSNEAYVFLSNVQSASVSTPVEDIAVLMPEEFNSLPKKELNKIIDQVEDIYFRRNNSLGSLLRFQRDAFFLNHIHRSATLQASASQHPVFYYEFSYSGERGVVPEPGVPKDGAAHSDELAYLFPENDQDFEGSDYSVQRNIITLWTNFVKYLDPTPEHSGLTSWEPTNPSEPRFLQISTNLEMKDFPFKRQMDFWDGVYTKYYYNSRG